MATTFDATLCDGSTHTFNFADVTALAAMSASECVAAGVSIGTKVTAAGVVYNAASSLQVFTTIYVAAGASSDFKSDASTSPTFSDDTASFVDITGLTLTVPDTGEYLLTLDGSLSTSIAATGGGSVQLLVNGSQVGPILALAAGCFIANNGIERSARLAYRGTLTAGHVCKAQIKRAAGAGIFTISNANISLQRVDS